MSAVSIPQTKLTFGPLSIEASGSEAQLLLFVGIVALAVLIFFYIRS